MREITNKYLFTRRPGKNNRAYGRVDNTINFATPSVHNTNVVTWFQHRPLSSLHQKAVFRKFCRVWHVTDRWPVDCSWPLRLNFSTAPSKSYNPSKLSLFKSTCRSESSYIMLSLLTITGRLGLGKWVIDWGKQSRVQALVCLWRVSQKGFSQYLNLSSCPTGKDLPSVRFLLRRRSLWWRRDHHHLSLYRFRSCASRQSPHDLVTGL